MAVTTKTAVEPGQRVRVTFEGYVSEWPDRFGGFSLYSDPDHWHVTVPPGASVEILPDPLKVGDELGASRPEPPEGTVLIDHDGVVWQRFSTQWRNIGGGHGTWESLSTSRIRLPLTVLYVPEVAP